MTQGTHQSLHDFLSDPENKEWIRKERERLQNNPHMSMEEWIEQREKDVLSAPCPDEQPDEQQPQAEPLNQMCDEGNYTEMNQEETHQADDAEETQPEVIQSVIVPVAPPVKNDSVTVTTRSPEEVERLRQQYLEGMKWQGTKG